MSAAGSWSRGASSHGGLGELAVLILLPTSRLSHARACGALRRCCCSAAAAAAAPIGKLASLAWLERRRHPDPFPARASCYPGAVTALAASRRPPGAASRTPHCRARLCELVLSKGETTFARPPISAQLTSPGTAARTSSVFARLPNQLHGTTKCVDGEAFS